ncbi:MAG: SpoIID/LytB domain-containing protein [Firmicutes bacterium]|nr:SpoIID/LytB domain-containing protein [Bacillota bacterium]
MRHWKVGVLLLLLTAVAVWPQVPAHAQGTSPVRVGLYYNASALSQVTVSSTGGLKLGWLTSGETWPVELLTQTGQATWLVRPETGGRYRVASGDLPDRATAADLQRCFERAVLAWTGSSWQIWVGDAADAANATALQNELASQHPEQTWRVVGPDGKRSELCTSSGQVLAVLPASDFYLAAAEGPFINFDNKPYRGWLELRQQGGRFRVINYVDLEDYLLGVVPREMSPSQPLEALKVQAIASRTVALTYRKHGSQGFDLCSQTCCQVYDHSRETANSNRAVQETRGLVITHQGQIKPVYYHADAGGHTENPVYVWGSSIPHMQSVPEPYPTNSPYEYWEERLTAAEIKQILAQMGHHVGDVLAVEPLAYTPAGRVERLRIVGTMGSTILEREAIRLNLRLKSRVYTVKADIPAVSVLAANGQVLAVNPSGLQVATAAGQQTLHRTDAYHLLGRNGQRRPSPAQAASFLFVGSGYGHGVGISQHGAYAMARQGHTYDEIIKYYYRDVEIVKLGD